MTDTDLSAMGAEAAQAEVAAIYNAAADDPKHAYNVATNPQHRATHQRMLALQGMVHPGVVDADTLAVGRAPTGIPGTGAASAQGQPTPADQAKVQAEIDAIRAAASSDPKHVYGDPSHPGHAEIHRKMLALQGVATPGTVDADRVAGADLRNAQVALPETPADYRIDGAYVPDDDPPEGVIDVMETAQNWAHEAGLSQGELDQLVTEFNALARDETRHNPAVDEARAAQSVTTLRHVWGDEFEAKVAAAQRVVARLGEGFVDFLENTRLGNNAMVIRALAETATRNNW